MQTGKPNLKLFNQLFCIIVGCFLIVFHTIVPISSIVRGGYPENTKTGKICLQVNIWGNNTFEKENWKLFLLNFAFSPIGLFFVYYLNLRVKRFLTGFCPMKKFSCIGVYKRNVISLSQTILWLHVWWFVHFSHMALLQFLTNQEQPYSKEGLFLFWNIKGFLFNEGLTFIIPLVLQIPKTTSPSGNIIQFYVRKPEHLVPERPNYTCKAQTSFNRTNTKFMHPT